MRPRNLILVALVVLAALALGFAAWKRHEDRPSPPPRQEQRRVHIPPEGFDAPMAEVIPMHKAVREAGRRFNGRVLEIALTVPSPDERSQGIALIYQMRLLTQRRDVVDIRMDALTGRFIEVSGADLVEARRKGKSEKKGD